MNAEQFTENFDACVGHDLSEQLVTSGEQHNGVFYSVYKNRTFGTFFFQIKGERPGVAYSSLSEAKKAAKEYIDGTVAPAAPRRIK